jgi:hypothetical protein
MEKAQFEHLLNEINDGIKVNKKTIDKAIEEEQSKGKIINFERIIEIINSYKTKDIQIPEGKALAIAYSGNPEVTMTYMLDSILYNNKVTLCTNGNKSINEILYNILIESLNACRIRNQWVYYNENYNEIFLRDNQNEFDKIIYIGDYFEYEKFKVFLKKDVEYNNFGYIKLFIDKLQYEEEYKKIFNFAYMNNISLEVYDDIEDFISESRAEDFAVIFADFRIINKIQRELRADEIIVNTFPYDTYKFKIIR